MLSRSEALARIGAALPAGLEVVERPLDEALGCVLAAEVRLDRDMPPFSRSAVDGWAVSSASAASTDPWFEVAGCVVAGEVPRGPLAPGSALKIMTGAPVPDGADAVVMVEDSELAPDGRSVRFRRAARPGQHVVRRGEDGRAGDLLLAPGHWLDPRALALLAMAGSDPVACFRPPAVCVLPTGDELVRPDGPPPPPGAIRETNGTMLAAQVRSVSPALRPLRPGIVRDDPESLALHLAVGLGHDLLILSGGVSVGELDLVEEALCARGLEVHVRKVAIKPGKPLLFGTAPRPGGGRCAVFGLPGNPVSSFVGFELFVRPFLRALLGAPFAPPPFLRARYVGPGKVPGSPREQHLPARLRAVPEGLEVERVPWNGSGDLVGLARASALAVVPRDQDLVPGSSCEVQALSGPGTVGPTAPAGIPA